MNSAHQSVPPLAGLRVIEFGQIAAGPFAGSLLADLGADVVKIERPDGGDDMRRWPPLIENEDGAIYSANFASVNRNKRSFAADLKNPDDVAVVRRLCAEADIVVENYRPGVLDRLGLGYAALSEINPELVFCSVSGYGQIGPDALRGAFDLTVQAASGLMSCTGEPGGAPVKVGVPVGDFCAGLYAVVAALAALRRGGGAHIDCSMLGAVLGISALQTSEYFGTGKPASPLGSAHPRNAPYQAFDASDRAFAIAAGNDRLWWKVCDVVGRPDLRGHDRFTTVQSRAQHQEELAGLLAPIFRTRPAQHWVDAFDAAGVPSALVKDFAETLRDPQVAAMGMLSRVELGNGVEIDAVGLPVRISDFDFSVYRRPPCLGEHNDSVLSDWLGVAAEPLP